MGSNIWGAQELNNRRKCYESTDPIIQTITASAGAGPGPVVLRDAVIGQWIADQDYILTRISFSGVGWNNLVFGPTVDGLAYVDITRGILSAISPSGGPFQNQNEIYLSTAMKCDSIGGGSVSNLSLDFNQNPKIIKANTPINIVGGWEIVSAGGGMNVYVTANLHLIQLFT